LIIDDPDDHTIFPALISRGVLDEVMGVDVACRKGGQERRQYPAFPPVSDVLRASRHARELDKAEEIEEAQAVS
jgi:hypothetical protein